jgi:cytochrome P450
MITDPRSQPHVEANLADPDFWSGPDVETYLQYLRRHEPVTWHEHPESGRGMWSVVRHEDVRLIGKDSTRFVNRYGVRPHHDAESGVVQPGTDGLITQDAPEHGPSRRTVAPSFAPRAIRGLEGRVRERARAIIDRLPESGTVDFVTSIAARLPLEITCDLMDVPEQDRDHLFDLSNLTIGDQDPAYGGTPEQGQHAALEMRRYGAALALERRRNPGDDVLSAFAVPRSDGRVLNEQELGGMFTLMIVAGNETTRTAISQGMLALTQHPGQQATWMGDPVGLQARAAEEILRWGTPVRSMGRIVAQDTELHGVTMRAGDKLTMWYCSANRDEDAFPDPYVFDVTRDPNPSLSFGGGPHVCLGAHLARLEIWVLFRELFDRFPDVHVVGEPQFLRSILVSGIKQMDVALT